MNFYTAIAIHPDNSAEDVKNARGGKEFTSLHTISAFARNQFKRNDTIEIRNQRGEVVRRFVIKWGGGNR